MAEQTPQRISPPSTLSEVKTKALYIYNYAWIPQFSVLGLVQGKIGWKSLSSFQWKFWITMFLLAYMTFQGSILIYYFQSALNWWRLKCNCDSISLIRNVGLIEGAYIVYYGKESLPYLFCRSFCI